MFFCVVAADNIAALIVSRVTRRRITIGRRWVVRDDCYTMAGGRGSCVRNTGRLLHCGV
jgi:hypothetical protein